VVELIERRRLTVILVAVALLHVACDGSAAFSGSTSETMLGAVSDGSRPLTGVDVNVACRTRDGVFVVGSGRSDEKGQYLVHGLTSPYAGASDYIVTFMKAGYEWGRVDLAEPPPKGVRVARCPSGSPGATVCRVIDVTLTPTPR
jgi:hypothetical protein